MTKYDMIKDILLSSDYNVKNITEKDDNLIVTANDVLTFVFYEGKTILDMYINDIYFGDIITQDLNALFHSIFHNDFIFVFDRKPKGMKKEYFKIEKMNWYHKNKEKLEKRRGIKVTTIDKVLIDKY